jgi:hypothetical protein
MKSMSKTPKATPTRLSTLTEVLLFLPLIALGIGIFIATFPFILSPFALIPVVTMLFFIVIIKSLRLRLYSPVLLTIVVFFDILIILSLAHIAYGAYLDIQGTPCINTFLDNDSIAISCTAQNLSNVLFAGAIFGILPVTVLMLIGALAQSIVLKSSKKSK